MIAIVDYGAGNLTSVRNAFAALGAKTEIVRDAASVAAADRVVFPGVGAAAKAMENLRSRGLVDAVRSAAEGKPFLGICLGMQVLFEHTEEDGGVDCLGLLGGKVLRFPEAKGVKVPEIGWNDVELGMRNEEYYFVHSYYVQPADESDTAAGCHYMIDFAAAVCRGRIFATQFHPEKSQDCGLTVLRNFVEFCRNGGGVSC